MVAPWAPADATPARERHGAMGSCRCTTRAQAAGALAGAMRGLGTAPDARRARLVSPPTFMAAKLAAFEGRGGGDVLRSHDIEDMIAVVAYPEEILGEVDNEPVSVGRWIRKNIWASLVTRPDAEYAVAGRLACAQMDPGPIPRVLERLRSLAEDQP